MHVCYIWLGIIIYLFFYLFVIICLSEYLQHRSIWHLFDPKVCRHRVELQINPFNKEQTVKEMTWESCRAVADGCSCGKWQFLHRGGWERPLLVPGMVKGEVCLAGCTTASGRHGSLGLVVDNLYASPGCACVTRAVPPWPLLCLSRLHHAYKLKTDN